MIKLIALLKRKPGISKEEFARRWVEDHPKFTWAIPGLREYRINIATERQPPGAPDFDGTAELWWDSIEEMEAAFNTPAGFAGTTDADQFADIRLHLYTEEHIIPPPRA
jgi:uncharacterized protein (TIGR02118 family)